MGNNEKSTNEKNNKAFGRHVFALRKARGYTQDQVAERSGLANDTIRRLEHGAFSPSLNTLRCLCRGYGMTLTALFGSFDLLELTTPEILADKVRSIPAELRTPVLALLSWALSLVEEVGTGTGE